MKLDNGSQLTYCTNIHAGETWAEVRQNLETHTLDVKRRVSPDRPFGIGLRLSAGAALTLSAPAALEEFQDFLAQHALYVFTVNGFPFGPFHGTPVKEQVYRPDWLEPERSTYTDRLAHILTALLRPHPGVNGSISTVPLAFRARADLDRNGADLARTLAAQAATLWRIQESGGPPLCLALEPEPECVLETTAQAIDFFSRFVFHTPGITAFAAATGLDRARAEDALRSHLGLCFDACHAAVEFEDAATSVTALRAAGLRVAKLQVSAGLRIPHPNAESLAALQPFAEGVYLHQVVIRRSSGLTRILDLPAALALPGPDFGDEWRVHFHVPLFQEKLGPFLNTHEFLFDILQLQTRAPFTTHLEVETYTWDVLPPEYRRDSVTAAIAHELSWTLDHLAVR